MWVMHFTPSNRRCIANTVDLHARLNSDRLYPHGKWCAWTGGAFFNWLFVKGTMVSAECYYVTLEYLWRAHNFCAFRISYEMLSAGVVLIHDNAHLHMGNVIKSMLQKCNVWEVFDHLPYSPDLGPSHFYLFPYLKKFLFRLNFLTGKGMQTTVVCWLYSQVADFNDTELQKFILWYDKCYNSGGYYV